MFKFLKEKFTGWLGKEKKEEPKEAGAPKETPKTKEKPKEKKETRVESSKKVEKKKEDKSPRKEKKELAKEESPVEKTKSEIPAEKAPEVKEKPSEKQKEEIKEEPKKTEEKPIEKKSFFTKLKEKFISEEAEKAPETVEEKTEEVPVREEPSPKTEIPVETKVRAPEKSIEKVEETPKEFLKEELKEEEPQGFFSKLKQKLTTSELKKDEFEEMFMELELSLLENNVALEVVDKIRESLAKDLVGIQVKKSEADEKILSSLKSAISQVLIEPPNLIEKIKSHKGKFVILFFGINGTGKTTSIAKLAWKLKQEGISCVLAAGDTFRAASIEQLETHANKIEVPIVKGEYGKDPASVAFDAIKYAEKNKIQVVLIDTAGRMYTHGNLMREMEKIVKVSQPEMKIFVGESITGNDALDQARSFNETAGIDGIILSKADVDDKAGTILSVSYITGKPILFLGVGQEYKDLQVFSKEKVFEGLGLE